MANGFHPYVDNPQDEEQGDMLISSPEQEYGSTSGIYNPFYTGSPRTTTTTTTKPNTIDRQELIRRIKNGDSRPTSPEIERSLSRNLEYRRRTPIQGLNESGLHDNRSSHTVAAPQNEEIGIQIERPRSALHRGDFRENDIAADSALTYTAPSQDPISLLSTSPVAPWHPAFPTAALLKQFREERRPVPSQSAPLLPSLRSRASPSALPASGFVYKPPTSPLVQSSRPDTPEPGARRRSRSPDKNRRHTFSPPSFQRAQSDQQTSSDPFEHTSPRIPSLQNARTFPYQAHQPRRSLNTNSLSTVLRSPGHDGRRPSLSDSPLHHAPMVGSYEESILRGRMSTTPSKPLNFVAQIGVLGKGECKPSLKCPPHASVAFPAVFYSYGLGNKFISNNDQPSPYVGLIDLENNLAPYETTERRRAPLRRPSLAGSRANSAENVDTILSDAQAQRRRKHKQKRRSCSPRAPTGGCYRIPQQGQLQIVIKNPNKTAVKLFLVPYDLSDMEPGQKTFIRQRSYSAGPIIDMPLSQRNNYGTDRPEAALSNSDDPNDRPVLRYLIHLNICCTAKGRYFLYKSIRVVFANRVPDGKEKLRNEIQLPDPRYSVYKASRPSNSGLVSSISTMTPRPIEDNNGDESHLSAMMFEPEWPQLHSHVAQSCPTDLPARSFFAPVLPTLESRPSSRHTEDVRSMTSTPSKISFSPTSPMSPSNDFSPVRQMPQLQDPFTFDRDRSRERLPGRRNESLLARRLMDLAFQGQAPDRDHELH